MSLESTNANDPEPDQARGAALAHLLNTLGEQAQANHPNDSEAANQETMRRLSSIMNIVYANQGEAQSQRTANIILACIFGVFWLITAVAFFISLEERTLYTVFITLFAVGPLGGAGAIFFFGVIMKGIQFVGEVFGGQSR